jgi:energy-coupling factor transporter ATP-binding protein EcfA2
MPKEVDIVADPFGEFGARTAGRRVRLLGCDFEFETDSPELRRIVDWCYAGLPRHKLSATVPRVRITLLRGRKPLQGAIPKIEMFSGAEFLGATTSNSDFVVLSAAQRAGLIVVSNRLLRSPYHVRYELLEFALFTLATRIHGLVGLHAACVGHGGRGLLIMGDSGAGKSTAALQSLLSGLEFLSEDSVFVTPDGLEATGVTNFLHVRRDGLSFVDKATAARIRRSPVIKRRSGVEKFEFDLRQKDFCLARRPLRIVGTVFLNAAPAGAQSLATKAGATETKTKLRQFQPYAAHQPGWKAFEKRIATLPAFHVKRGGHPTETVKALEDILARIDKH